MATVTFGLASAFSTTSGTKSTAAPAAVTVGDLCIVITAHTGNTSTTAPTDNNSDGLGTYSLIDTAVKASSADTMKAWVRDRPFGTTSTTTITHAPGTTTGGGLLAWTVSGIHRIGTAAIRQSAKQDNQAGGGTPTPVLGVAALTTNPLVGMVFNATNPAGLTARSSPAWSEDNDAGYGTPATGREAAHINSGETATSIAWGGTSASAFCSIVVELDTSALIPCTGIVSLEAFGLPAVGSVPAQIDCTGILSAEAFGSAVVGPSIVGAGGIASAEAFGSPTLADAADVQLRGISLITDELEVDSGMAATMRAPSLIGSSLAVNSRVTTAVRGYSPLGDPS